MRKLLPVMLCAAVLGACSDHKKPAHKEAGQDTPQVESVLPQAQRDALDKAQGVEGTLLQAEQQRRSEMDAQ